MLNTVKNFRTAMVTQTIITIVVCVLSLGATTFIYLDSRKAIEDSKREIYILDDKGNIYTGEKEVLNIRHRESEFKDHIRDFYTLWYQFDQNSYHDNTERALWLIGDRGEEMRDERDVQGLYDDLTVKNLIYTIEIKKIEVDMTKKPYTGIIEGTQNVHRGGHSAKRNMVCTFTIKSMPGRSDVNSHGCMIEEWEEIDKTAIIDKR